MKISKKYGINENVHFLGYRSDVCDLLNNSELFIQASYREVSPRFVMEAMAIGLPCLVSKIRGNIDLIVENMGGYLFGIKDYKNLFSEIIELSKGEVKRELFGNYNNLQVEKYDIHHICENVINIYEEIGGN